MKPLDIGSKLSLLPKDELHCSLNFFVGHHTLQNVRLKLLECILQNLQVATNLKTPNAGLQLRRAIRFTLK